MAFQWCLIKIPVTVHRDNSSTHVILRERRAANQSQNKLKLREMFLKPGRPKNLRFKQAGKIMFDLTQQKKQSVALETKDSSSADHYLPNNNVRGRPPQNDKF
jgi:hypothetical protein